MPTKVEYEKLLLHSLEPGDVVRVPMASAKEWNSQRVTFDRARRAVKRLGINTDYISYSKEVDSEGAVFLQITHARHSATTFQFKEGDKFIDKNIEADGELSTVEDKEFVKWLEDQKKAEESE